MLRVKEDGIFTHQFLPQPVWELLLVLLIPWSFWLLVQWAKVLLWPEDTLWQRDTVYFGVERDCQLMSSEVSQGDQARRQQNLLHTLKV